MAERRSAFAPTIVGPVFSERAYLRALAAPLKPRQLFYTLQHIHEQPDELVRVYSFLKTQLTLICENYQHRIVDACSVNVFGTSEAASDIIWQAPLTSRQKQLCLKQIAPLCLTEPCWLAAIAQAATSQDPLAVALLGWYLQLKQGQSIKNLFQAALLQAGIPLPAIQSFAYTQSPEISEAVFEFAAIQLALGQFPRVFFPECLGFTLAYGQAQSVLQQFASQDQVWGEYIAERRSRLTAQYPVLLDIIERYLALFPEWQVSNWQRMQIGFYWYQHHKTAVTNHLRQCLQMTRSPAQAFIALLISKVSVAVGHHTHIQLAGRSLDAWLQAMPDDAPTFLNALAASPLVDHHNPDNSRLLKLFEFNGPMFGVLNTEEFEIVQAWLLSVTTQAEPIFLGTVADSVAVAPPPQAVDNHQVQHSLSHHFDNRGLFYALINSEYYPEVLPVAQQRVQRILRWARWFGRLPFKAYQHARLDAYVQRLYQLEIANYRPLALPPKFSKATYRWGIEQFAPAILTDGCWLQNSHHLTESGLQELTANLFKIYVDELGAGVLEQNHPYIYQQLLENAGFSLPPVFSSAFAEYPGFLTSAFDLPIYLMAISKFPNRFLPELLGLNLAIELSGLGKTYLRLAQALRYYGFNPAIVNVHISIDNLASGHAALAKTAIQYYLDYVTATQGRLQMNAHWQRVYVGYRSLAIASTRFKLALLSEYWISERY